MKIKAGICANERDWGNVCFAEFFAAVDCTENCDIASIPNSDHPSFMVGVGKNNLCCGVESMLWVESQSTKQVDLYQRSTCLSACRKTCAKQHATF